MKQSGDAGACCRRRPAFLADDSHNSHHPHPRSRSAAEAILADASRQYDDISTADASTLFGTTLFLCIAT
jgi:hypothetical protein